MHVMLLFVAVVLGASPAKATQPAPIIAATFSGQELVIEPDLTKVRAAGITLEQLQAAVKHRRLSEMDGWEVEIVNKKIQLGRIAKLTVRDLQTPPFSVELPDGREVHITADPKLVADYMVTGAGFEENVRRSLASPWPEEPQQVNVMSGIRVFGGGRLDYATRADDHVHISLGEPLEKIAKVEVRGERGPQAAQLQRMRNMHKHAEKAVARCEGMSREAFERKFGKSMPKEAGRGATSSIPYSLPPGRLELFFSRDGKTVSNAYIASGCHEPYGVSPSTATVARKHADAERAILLAFLKRRYAGGDKKDLESLRGIVDESQADAQWTNDERNELLGD